MKSIYIAEKEADERLCFLEYNDNNKKIEYDNRIEILSLYTHTIWIISNDNNVIVSNKSLRQRCHDFFNEFFNLREGICKIIGKEETDRIFDMINEVLFLHKFMLIKKINSYLYDRIDYINHIMDEFCIEV